MDHKKLIISNVCPIVLNNEIVITCFTHNKSKVLHKHKAAQLLLVYVNVIILNCVTLTLYQVRNLHSKTLKCLAR